MRLYYADTPNSRKVRAVAAYLGLDLEYELVDLAADAHKREAYLAINPTGRVPTLWEGTTHLWESNAIACRLALEAGSDLWPADHRQVEVLRWLSWDSEHFKPAIGCFFVENLVKPHFGAEPDRGALERAAPALDQQLGLLDRTLAGRDFIIGPSPTIADFALATFMPYAAPAGVALESFGNVTGWCDRMATLPGCADPFPRS